MKKRLIISLIFIALFSTYKPQKLNSLKKFNIEEILIENNYILKKEEIKKKIILDLSNKLIIFRLL